MNFWIDAQLPPTLADWLIETFGVIAMAASIFRRFSRKKIPNVALRLRSGRNL